MEEGLDKICKEIKGESVFDNAVGIYNNRIMALFYIIFPENEKMATVRHNVKWFDSEAKQLEV